MFQGKLKSCTLPGWVQIWAEVNCKDYSSFPFKSSHDIHILRNAAKKLLITRSSFQICTCLSYFTWLSNNSCTFFCRLKLSQDFEKIFVTMKLCNNQYQLNFLSSRELCVTSDPLPRALIPQGRLLLCCFLDASRQCEHEMGKHAIKGGRIATCRRAEHFLWCDMHQIHTKSPYNSWKDSIHLEGFRDSILCGMQIFFEQLVNIEKS